MSDPNSAKFRERLLIVFRHGNPVTATTPGLAEAWRYVPRALPNREYGSGQWGVYDRKLSKFLNSAEVYKVPINSLRDEKHHDA